MTNEEQIQKEDIFKRFEKIKNFLSCHEMPTDNSNLLNFLLNFKEVEGNVSNCVSFIASLQAKKYLMERFSFASEPNMALHAQGAPGLDIELQTANGERIIGEIKTTIPYKGNKLGAQQKASFEKDIKKLREKSTKHKFFFLTNKEAAVCAKKLLRDTDDIKIVLL